jgi:hypothetical protein
MSSIIDGYNYDIFVSYRKKDNKGDRWVSEFVEALKTEIESTFKEDISVYFDINPRDGLLETHDVDASLKDKLKCLVFIPVISRTYCDPKSFAWEHEFKVFVDLASHDKFGFKINLPNGNVAARVIPVRIHDLDPDDIKLCESLTGGFLRGVEFIYKEPGVNRPLKPDDDEKINLNKTKYRNQINKTALATKEILESMRMSGSSIHLRHENIQYKESKDKSEISTKELPEESTVKSGEEIYSRKFKPERIAKALKKPGILIPVIAGILVIFLTTAILLDSNSKVRIACEKALAGIGQIINKTGFSNNKSPVEGIWKLTYGKWYNWKPDDTLTYQFPGNMDIYHIKIFSNGNFTFIGHYNMDTLTLDNYGGGTYTLTGDRYEENLLYAGNKIFSKKIKMLSEIRKDTLIQKWPVDKNWNLVEKFSIEKYIRLK